MGSPPSALRMKCRAGYNGYKLLLDELEHLGANATDFADEVIRKLGGVDGDFPAADGADEGIGLISHGGLPLLESPPRAANCMQLIIFYAGRWGFP